MNYRSVTVDYSDFIVMLARQRSGTNSLRSVLEAHPDLFCSPEIFHPTPSSDAHLEVEMNYFEFLEQHTKGDIKRVLTSRHEQETVFLDYLNYLRCFSDKRYVLLDVKYNSAHTIDGPWHAIGREPELFVLIRRHGLRVLNVTRRNYLRYYLSWKKTELTEQYTDASQPGAGVEDQPIEVPLDEMTFHLEQCRRESAIVSESFAPYPLYFELEYGDLFPVFGEPPSTEELRRVSAWLAIDPRHFDTAPKYGKQALLPLEQTLANYRQVVKRLRGTRYEYCLEDERGYRAASEVLVKPS